MQIRPWSRRLASLVVGGLVLAGCSSDTTPTAERATSGTAATDSSQAGDSSGAAETEVTDEALPGPVFETVSGGQFDLNSLEGTDTVLWFWAPW